MRTTLSSDDRKKFIAYLSEQVADEALLLEQLQKLNIPPMEQVKRAKIMAYKTIIKDLIETEVVTL